MTDSALGGQFVSMVPELGSALDVAIAFSLIVLAILLFRGIKRVEGNGGWRASPISVGMLFFVVTSAIIFVIAGISGGLLGEPLFEQKDAEKLGKLSALITTFLAALLFQRIQGKDHAGFWLPFSLGVFASLSILT